VTSMLAQVWSSDGGRQGGRLLDEALTSLGEAYVKGDRVVWELPEDLDPSIETIYWRRWTNSIGSLKRA
jgi:hypothetical protein